MLSARSEDVDSMQGLETGADDYVTEPYSVIVLVVRIKSQLWRIHSASIGDKIEYNYIHLDKETYAVFRDGYKLKLGPLEFSYFGSF